MNKLREAKLRYARYYLQLAEEHRTNLSLLDLELSNIMAAADYCIAIEDWQLLTNMTTAINDYLLKRTRWTDYIYLNNSLITNDLAEHTAERSERINRLSELEEFRGNYAEAIAFCEWLIPSYEQGGNIEAAIETCQRASRLARTQGSYDDAYQYLARGLSLAREYSYRKDEVDLFYDCAIIYEKIDCYRAQDFCEAALDIARSFDYFSKTIDILTLQSSLFVAQHRLQNAWSSSRDALDIAARIHDIPRADNIREQLTKLGEIMGRNIFISYNHQDRGLVARLANDLKAAGLPVWWDEWEIKVGQSIIQKVSDGISRSAYLIAVLSPHSVQSNWVQREIGSALMKQLSTEREIVILPLLVADCEIPVLLREIKWADFRESHTIGLNRLLDVLVNDTHLPPQ